MNRRIEDRLIPDENACELYRRIRAVNFEIRTNPQNIEQIGLSDTIEVLANASDVPEFVLSVALDYANQFVDQNPFLLHVSTGTHHTINRE